MINEFFNYLFKNNDDINESHKDAVECKKTGMGIGVLPGPVERKHRHRWTYTWLDKETKEQIVSPQFVELTARPSMRFEETELNYLSDKSEKSWVPGKATWDKLTIKYINCDNELQDGLNDVFNECFYPANDTSMKTHEGSLQLWDNGGNLLESWKLKNAFPQDISWEFNMEIGSVEVGIRFSDSEYKAGNDE